jgi:hypothetical protein
MYTSYQDFFLYSNMWTSYQHQNVQSRDTGIKCYRNSKGQSRIDNPEKQAPLGTQDTGRKHTKQKHNIEN